MSPKNRLNMRIDERLEAEVDELAQLYEKKTGIKTTKTNVIESAIKEGLKIIRKRLEGK